MEAIQGGEECERLIPVLSAVADGEAGADELALLRPHMKTCLSCRARLKEFRALPARVAAHTPVAQDTGALRTLVESAFAGAQQKAEGVLGATQQKAALFGERAHMAAELATGQKLAAVAASAAALAGGGTAIDQFANHRGPPPPAVAAKSDKNTPAEKRKVALLTQAPVRAVHEIPIQPATDPAPQPARAPADTPPPRRAAPRRPALRRDPANEFAPAPVATGQATPTPAQTFEPAGLTASVPSGTTESGSTSPGSAGSGSAAPRPVAGSQNEFAP